MYHKPNARKRCSCGRSVFTDMFGGYCSSFCVESAVDARIENDYEKREAQQLRDEMRLMGEDY